MGRKLWCGWVGGMKFGGDGLKWGWGGGNGVGGGGGFGMRG